MTNVMMAVFEKSLLGAMANNDGETKADDFLVYADHLLQEGDPRGELVQIQHQRERRPRDEKLRKAEKALLAKHRAAWMPQLPQLRQLVDEEGEKEKTKTKKPIYTWRLGFFDSVTLAGATPSLIRAVMDHPSARFVRELVIDAGFLMMPAVVLALAARPRPSLRSLTLRQDYEGFNGDVKPDAADASYKAGYGGGRNQKRGNALWTALPNLTSLTLKAYQLFGELVHPSLKELAIDGYPICSDSWKTPKLERLSWEVGMDETGTYTDAGSYMVAAIWKGKLPALRKLDLSECGSIVDDEVMDDEEESGDEIDDTCAASLLRIKGFQRAIQQLDELELPEVHLKTRKEIVRWLEGSVKKRKK
jgi:uncharacterized protein (TIGR02996 family)